MLSQITIVKIDGTQLMIKLIDKFTTMKCSKFLLLNYLLYYCPSLPF